MIMRVKVQTLNDDVYYVSQILIREFFVSLRNGLPSGVFFAPHYYVQMIPQIARPDVAHCVINLKCFIIRIRRLPNLIFSCCCSSSALNAYILHQLLSASGHLHSSRTSRTATRSSASALPRGWTE